MTNTTNTTITMSNNITFRYLCKDEDIQNAKRISFPSIDHFNSFVKELKHQYKSCLPGEIPEEFNLRGTVKLHGTHADVVYHKNNADDATDITYDITYQSRNRILSLEADNCGFAKFMESIPTESKEQLFHKIKSIYKMDFTTLTIAGEFCGGNIQKGVALTGLPLFFAIFCIKIDDVVMDILDYASVELPENRVFNIVNGGIFRTKMSYKYPDDVVPYLIKVTDDVEKECPFAKFLGVSGVGEGVVWVCEDHVHSSRFWFKVKGVEHSVSKVKVLKEKSPEEQQRAKNIADFLPQVVTDARLRQGLDYLREMNLEKNMKNTGVFIKWVIGDIIKEESDYIDELKLDIKKLNKQVAFLANAFYKRAIMEDANQETKK